MLLNYIHILVPQIKQVEPWRRRVKKESHFIQARRLNLAKENPEKKKQSNLEFLNRKKKRETRETEERKQRHFYMCPNRTIQHWAVAGDRRPLQERDWRGGIGQLSTPTAAAPR
jgi:hypothetical protein